MATNVLIIALSGLLSQWARPYRAPAASPTVPVASARSELGRHRQRPAGGVGNAWRYVFHEGRWWYWSASERWSYFDGGRWVDLDLLNRPIMGGRELGQAAWRRRDPLSREGLRFRFGELPTPRSRAGNFNLGGTAGVAGRNFAGSFETGAALPHALLAAPGEAATPFINPYGPDSEYGAFGSTNPFRGGMHSGAGGNYGYGLGAERAATIQRPATIRGAYRRP